MNQAETERVEAQNRKLLAENQKVKIYLWTSIRFVQIKEKIEIMRRGSNAMEKMLEEKKN